MTPAKSSDARNLHSGFVAFILQYVALPDPKWADMLALWAMGTWIYAALFDAYPYLVVTSATKRSGKTRLGVEVLPRLCFNAMNTGAITPAMLYRTIEDGSDTGITLTFDESERLFNEGSGLREFLNMGYRKGQRILRGGQDGKPESFRVYCPKVFVLIGDVYDTLRDRSIVCELYRADYAQMRALKVYRESVINADVAALLGDMTADRMLEYFGNPDTDRAFTESLEFLDSRDAEIWAPIFAMAEIACPDKLSDIRRVAADLCAAKTADARKAIELRQQEAERQQEAYGERALRDMARVIDGHGLLTPKDAVAALRNIDVAPWRMYRGTGLTEIMLAQLLKPFGVNTQVKRIGRGVKHSKPTRGYLSHDIRQALHKLGE